MSLIKLYYLQNFLLKWSVLILFIFTFFSLLLFYFTKLNQTQMLTYNVSTMKIVRMLLTISVLVSLFLYLLFIYSYTLFISKLNILHSMGLYFVLPTTNLYFFKTSVDLFGVVVLFLAYVSGILSFLAMDTRIFWKNIKYMSFLNIFVLIVFFFVFTDNLLVLFFFYELLLIPSFLLVYYIAPSRRAIQASLYFIIWTQVGSFFVLCVTSYILSVVGSADFFFIKNYNFTDLEAYFLFLFLFLGFGFKVPIWPFHYWLTKTHVEAPTGFSMYLSGFLVKSALYGFYKISNLIGGEFNSVLFSTLTILGILDASLKMWGQTDVKKLVAYGTVQEMNIIYLAFCWGDSYSVVGGIIFCITHCFLSVMMFYLVDCIQRRYNSRSVTEISGILQTTPTLGITILVMCVLYSGVPGTLKFTSEFYIFSGLFETSPFSCFLVLFIANVVGLIGFSKCWFNIVFGMNNKNMGLNTLDLSYKELYILYICIFFLVFFCFFTNVFF